MQGTYLSKALTAAILPAALIPSAANVYATQTSRPALADKTALPTNIYGLPVAHNSGTPKNYTFSEIQELGPEPEFADSNNATKTPELTDLSSRSNSAPLLHPTWSYPFLASGVGLNLWAGPTSNGNVEIYVGSGTSTFSSNSYWAALAYDSSTNSYQSMFSSQSFPQGIVEIMVGDVTGNDRVEIVVALANGTIVVYDQLTKNIIKTFPTLSAVNAMRLADMDETGKQEIIVCSASTTAVYSNEQLQWTVNYGGTDLTIAQMDGDTALEIALASGYVIDSSTRALQWNRGSAFGARVHATDFDSDGKAELIAAEPWYYVWAFDVDMQLPKWSYRADLDITALAVTDFDSDGNVEIAIGDGQWGDVYAIDPNSLSLKYKVPNPEHSVAGIAVVDADGDGQKELIWGAGYSSTGQDLLLIANPVIKAIEWTSTHLDGPVIGPEIGDLDGDGKDEIVAASYESRSSYSSGRILVFDKDTLKLRAMSAPICGDRAWEGLNDLKLRDVDQDGKMEIIVAADYLYDGVIEVYDFSSTNEFTLSWTNASRPNGSPYSAIDAIDIDGDGTMEILAGNNRAHTGSAGTFLRVLDYQTRNVEWTSFHFGGSWSGVADVGVADLDTTPGLEMAALGGGNVFIFDGPTKAAKAVINGNFSAMKIKDNSIFLSDAQGNIKQYQYDGTAYTQTSQVSLGGAIDGFNIVSAHPTVIIYGTGGSLKFYAGGAVRAQSANYGSPYGAQLAGGATGGAYSLGMHRHHALPPSINPEPSVNFGPTNEISWTNEVPGAIAYMAQADTDPAFSSPISTGWIYDNFYDFNDLEYGVPYYFRVKSLFIDGETESTWSDPITTTQEPGSTAAKDWNLFI